MSNIKTKEQKGYYEFDIDWDDLMSSMSIDEIFYVKDLQQRKLFLNDEIEECSVAGPIKHIMQFNREDADKEPEQRQPILLYIASNGGNVDPGFELIDAIQSSVTPVYTINLGYAYSMAMLIYMAGHKRFATKSSKFLLHDGTDFVFGTGSKVRDQVKFSERQEARLKEYILSQSTITPEEYDANLRVEWYMFAEEAKEKGIVDQIIGVDCGMIEVV